MAEAGRLVYLINGLTRGGGERLLVELVRETDRQRYLPVVYALTRLGPLALELRHLGVKVHRLTRAGIPLPWAWVRFCGDLRHAEALHTHFFYSDLVGGVFGRLFCVPRRVASRHETGYWMPLPHRLLEPWVYRGFNRVLCVSGAVAAALTSRGVPRSVLKVIHPGVHIRSTRPKSAASNAAPYIIAVGRLERVKGHDILVRALAQLKDDSRLAAWRLLIVGGGRQQAYLRGLAARLGVAERCQLLGDLSTERVRDLVAGAAIFVLPSRSEAAPLSLLEAMELGVPCVATRVGGTPELVDDGVDGLLVAPEDPRALAQAILTLALDPELARRLGERAQRTVRERFDLHTYVQAVVASYATDG